MANKRVSKKDLQELTTELNELENRPTQYSGPATMLASDGRRLPKVNVGHIILDHNPTYGGYALREVTSINGAQSFYHPSWVRISAREMYEYLYDRVYGEEGSRLRETNRIISEVTATLERKLHQNAHVIAASNWNGNHIRYLASVIAQNDAPSVKAAGREIERSMSKFELSL